MPKHVGELSTNFCDSCPIARKLGDQRSGRAGIYGAEIIRWGGVDILAVINPENGNYFREEVVSGSITQEKVQTAIDECEGPVTQSRRILPDKLVCGAIKTLLQLSETKVA